ncbi:MAG: hypothetical protein PWQ96_1285 [Clostridia bacterium]|jgi:cytochrome oxidase Cu insertion factor (SCO1/SenC/PrrC family)|nr:AhpC/TSA family [Clostridiales bacterium]MDK2985643.1 hypothetical protein [Clostridia bacterium]
MKRILIVFLALFVGLFFYGCTNPQNNDGIQPQPQEEIANDTTETAPVEGKIAPDFELEDLKGEKIALSDFRGKPVLLVFWATT